MLRAGIEGVRSCAAQPLPQRSLANGPENCQTSRRHLENNPVIVSLSLAYVVHWYDSQSSLIFALVLRFGVELGREMKLDDIDEV